MIYSGFRAAEAPEPVIAAGLVFQAICTIREPAEPRPAQPSPARTSFLKLFGVFRWFYN